MIKLGVTVLAGALLLTGCSEEPGIGSGQEQQEHLEHEEQQGNEEQPGNTADPEAEAWDYKQGRVVAIDVPKLLVVQSSDITDLEMAPTKEAIEELLQVVKPDAVWVTVADDTMLEGIEVGDEVHIEIAGELTDTYPAEGTASDVREVIEVS